MSTESVMLSNHHHSTPLLWGRDPCLFLCMFICLNNICWRDFSFPMELSWHLPWKLISHKCFASELWILIQLIRVYPYTSATVSSFLYSCCFEIVIYVSSSFVPFQDYFGYSMSLEFSIWIFGSLVNFCQKSLLGFWLGLCGLCRYTWGAILIIVSLLVSECEIAFHFISSLF